MLEPLWKTFIKCYGIKLNLIGTEIHMQGGEKLPPEKMLEIETWIKQNHDHVINRLKQEGGYKSGK